MILSLTNTADAYIADGAQIDCQGNLSVSSNTNVLVVNFISQGGQAHEVGLNGGIGYTQLSNQSEAYVAATATISAGGNVSVNATYNLLGVIITGANSKAPIGVGVSVAFNDMSNDTQAFIGEPAGDSPGLPAGSVTAGGNVSVEATTSEMVYSVSVAGTLSSTNEGGESGKGGAAQGTPAPADVTVSDPQGTEESAEKQGGIGISGAATVNDLHNDATEAYITNNATVSTPDSLTVQATSTLDLLGAGGAISADRTIGASNGVQLAGAFVINVLNEDSSGNEREAEAFTQNATLLAKNTTIDASNTALVLAFAAGAAGSLSTKGLAGVAGSVTLDLLSFETLAELGQNTTLLPASGITPQGLTISAGSSILQVSAAGGVAVSGKVGAGAGIDVGVSSNTVTATIGPDADVRPTGNVEVTGTGTEYAVSAAISLAAALGNLGVSGSAASQTWSPDIEAFIAPGSTVLTPGSVLVAATDNLIVIAVGGGIGAGDDAGLGAALGNVNLIETVEACVASNDVIAAAGNGAKLTTPDGDLGANGLVVYASGVESLGSFGAAGAGGQDAGVAGSAAVNTVTNTILAYINQGTTVNAGVNDLAADEAVDVVANQSLLDISVGGALGVAISPTEGGEAVTIGVGVATEVTSGTVLAYTDGAIIDAGGGGIELSAVEAATVVCLALGGAVSASFGGDGGTSVGLVGAGCAVTIDDEVEADAQNGSSLSTTNGGNVSISSSDTTNDTANAGGVGFTAASSDGTSVGVSVGTAVAINVVGNTVEAFLDRSSVDSSGGVSLSATEKATVSTLSIGGAVAAGASTGSGTAPAERWRAPARPTPFPTTSRLTTTTAACRPRAARSRSRRRILPFSTPRPAGLLRA